MHHNIILKELSLAEMKVIYDERMIKDFPSRERKKWDLIQDLFNREIYEGVCAFEGNDLVGYAFFSMDSTYRFYLLDYLAITKELRGQGYGSSMLKAIAERLADVDILICEIDNPYLEDDSLLKDQELKRMEFYLSNGWMDTGIDAWMYDVEFRLLHANLKNSTNIEDILRAYESIYRSAIRTEELDRNMRLRMHEK